MYPIFVKELELPLIHFVCYISCQVALDKKEAILASVPAESKERGSLLYESLIDGKVLHTCWGNFLQRCFSSAWKLVLCFYLHLFDCFKHLLTCLIQYMITLLYSTLELKSCFFLHCTISSIIQTINIFFLRFRVEKIERGTNSKKKIKWTYGHESPIFFFWPW